MYNLGEDGLGRLLQIDPDTLRRMVVALEDAGDWEFANACWEAITTHNDIENMPGDELQRLYASAEMNGKLMLSRRLKAELGKRLIDSHKEPLRSRATR